MSSLHRYVQNQAGDMVGVRLVCIRPLGPGEEITYFYGNRLYIMDEIGPVPAGKVNTKDGFSLHEEV